MEGLDSTVREESVGDARPRLLALEWVWPEPLLVRLKGAKLDIGRDEAAHLRLCGVDVSRRHAELYRQGPIYVLRDLRSTNGTWLDGARIQHAAVGPGATLRVGQHVGVFTSIGDDRRGFSELVPGLFGSDELAARLAPLEQVAQSKLPVMLVGRTGTGKERVAQAVHELSARTGPYLAINCAALPEQLAEAELFGYRRGAFTGAERGSVGHFRAADGGTLFLDEIADLPLGLQAKLLRVLEDGQVFGLGESRPTRVDVRIVAAAQQSLAELVQRGRFREDLAARLRGIEVSLPVLADRRVDIAHLFLRFLRRECGARPPAVDARLIEALVIHDWPQNVRQLELATRRLVAEHGRRPLLKREHLPTELWMGGRPSRATGEELSNVDGGRREYELARVRSELERNGGNVKEAASSLHISRQRIYRLLRSAAVAGRDGQGTHTSVDG
jgi:transcriptional regulator with PAS, ATPase and Fis domain